MAHFQLIAHPPIVKHNTRCWLKGNSGTEQIVLHLGAKVMLEQWGMTPERTMPSLYSDTPSVAAISDEKIRGQRQSFMLTGKMAGSATLNGKRDWQPNRAVPAIKVNDVYPLKVSVGNFAKHTDMAIDLLAEKLGRSNDAFKIMALQRLLHNNADDANLFDQNSNYNIKRFHTNLACGDVVAHAGRTLLGPVSTASASYHIPLQTVSSRNDVKYDPGKLSRACAAIKKLLQKGTAVRVGLTHGPSKTQLSHHALQPTSSGGHFVLIVGCNAAADKFLYVDPWEGGSQLLYQGGVIGSKHTSACQFLGMFAIDHSRGCPVLRQTKGSEGSFSSARDHYLEVIAGPL